MNLKSVFISIVLGLSMTLGACGTFTVHDDTAEVLKEDPVKGVQQLIDEGYAVLISASRTLKSQYEAGAIPQNDAIKYQSKLEDALKRLGEADTLMNQGKTLEAKDKASLARSLISVVQAELIKRSQQ